MDPAKPPLVSAFIGSSSPQSPLLEAKVHAELLTARKSREGLSPMSMSLCPVIRDLLGEGDPLVAFQSLQHRILASLDSEEDHRALEAAAYSLGLQSKGDTHLSRLIEFGQEHGYEARQARRHSDRGIRLLARLIASNWIINTVPSLDVVLAPHSDKHLAFTLQTARLAVISMQPIVAFSIAPNGAETTLHLDVSTSILPSSPGDDITHPQRIIEILTEPILLPVPTPGSLNNLRVQWRGEVWPKIAVSLPAGLGPTLSLQSHTLASTLHIIIAAKQ